MTMEGEQEERDAKVRKRIAQLYGDQLTDDEIEMIIHLYNKVYGAVNCLISIDDRTIQKMCEMLKPYLHLVWHGRWHSLVDYKRSA
jgi:hypothetical protein